MQNKPACLFFLSWQSDRRKCRSFVSSVVKKIPAKVADFTRTIIDRDTVNVPGSPDIGDTIFEKIDNCDLFIADITLINDKSSQCRLTPNPNVMIELGYAIKTLGWDRILLLQCSDYGSIEDQPFDINHRRICNYTLGLDAENEEEKNKIMKESKEHVINIVAESIHLLYENNMLFGGKKVKAPKFEIAWKSNDTCMSNLSLNIKNVSSALTSELKSHAFYVSFMDNTRKDIEYKPYFETKSLSSYNETTIHFRNKILGYGPGYNNSVWTNIDLIWQFSCEDDENTIYWYEMRRHINDAVRDNNCEGDWKVRLIG